jgi:hypothetical protein
MNAVKILWAANFFFFALVMIYVWSKTIIIAKKLSLVDAALERATKLQTEKVDAEKAQAQVKASIPAKPAR